MTSPTSSPPVQERFKCFEETHQEMVETAVRLISEKGIDSLSIAALTRAMNIHRNTVYYHFANREALLDAVKKWSSERLLSCFSLPLSRLERIDHVADFVLENPELIKLWIDDFISESDIRKSYPQWDETLNALGARIKAEELDNGMDLEVFFVIMLTAGVIGPRVLKNSLYPDVDNQVIKERFSREFRRLLAKSIL